MTLAATNYAGVTHVPEERVLQMMRACADQIERVANIQDAKAATSAAEALAVIARKVDIAKEVKRQAVRLLVKAEAKLGEVLRALPKNQTPTKRDMLREGGINRRRASTAERLAITPQKDIDRVIAKGAQTLHGVTTGLGLESNGYELRTEKASAYQALAEEAVGLLERSVKEGKAPHAGTVASYVGWLANLKAHGNRRVLG